MRASLCRRSIIVVVLVAGLLAARPGLCAQEKIGEPRPRPFVETEAGLNTCAMIACLGSAPFGHPPGVVLTRMLASKENLPLPEWQFDFKEPLPLPRVWLEKTIDNRPLPRILHRQLSELGPDLGFYMSLNHALNRVHFANQEMFEEGALEEEHRVYADLKATPGRFRGKIISVTGKLEVIRRVDTPRLASEWFGKEMPFIYTAWITAGPSKTVPAYAVVFTHLPGAIPKESEKFENVHVGFHGYFLGIVDFTPEDAVKGKTRAILSPYLVGKSLTVLQGPAPQKLLPPPDVETSTPVAAQLMAWIVSAIVIVALALAAANVWVRRNDRRTQAKLAELRHRQQAFGMAPTAESPPLASPVLETPPRADEGIKPGDPA